MELRPYQLEAIETLRERVRQGHRRLLLQAPTGSGKTQIAAEVIRCANDKQSSTLFLAHRRELVFQAEAKLREFGVPAGVIMAGEYLLARFCQVASTQTLWRRYKRDGHLPPCDLLVLDECHRALSRTNLELIEAYPNARVLGLTATPIRTDGRGLGKVFDTMVRCPSMTRLQADGYLVPLRYFTPTKPDLEGLTVRAGDYVDSELADRMDKPVLVGDVVEHWGRLAEGRKSVVFAINVAHSRHLREQFVEAGVKAAHVDGTTDRDERDAIWEDLRRGGIQVVCNCDVATEGLDVPELSCVVLARPTKSIVKYLQCVGRVMRPHPESGKTEALVIDHAGIVHDHGFAEEFTDWSLEPGDGRPANPTQERRKQSGAIPIVCEKCFTTYKGKPRCPNCGHEHVVKGRGISHVDGELGEVQKTGGLCDVAQHEYSREDKERWHCMLRGLAMKRGYADGWVFHTYRRKFGVQPANGMRDLPAMEPNTEVLGFVRHLLIRYAKAKAA